MTDIQIGMHVCILNAEMQNFFFLKLNFQGMRTFGGDGPLDTAEGGRNGTGSI